MTDRIHLVPLESKPIPRAFTEVSVAQHILGPRWRPQARRVDACGCISLCDFSTGWPVYFQVPGAEAGAYVVVHSDAEGEAPPAAKVTETASEALSAEQEHA